MNDVRDFWKVILLALVLNVLWDACLYYETPPIPAMKSWGVLSWWVT